MARTETDQLVVQLEARVREFEKGMERASGTADKQFGKMRKSASKAGKEMESSLAQVATRVNGALGKLGLGGIAAGGLAGLVAGVSKLASGIAETGDAARKAGIDFKSFQQLAYVAKVNRIEVDKVTDGIKELQLRGAEFFTTGSGSAAEAFKALGYSADQVREKLKKPAEFLTEIIDKLGKLDRASQINLADKLFGGSAAEDFVKLIDRGAEGIRDQIKEGERLGAVLTDDVLAKAQELDGLIKTAAESVSNHLKRAIIDAAYELAGFVDKWKEFDNQRNSTLDSQLATIGKRRLDIENQILRTKEQQASSFKGNPWGADYDGIILQLQQENEELAEQERQILAVLKSRGELDKKPPLPTVTLPTKPKDDTRSNTVSAMERERAAADKLIASLEEELRVIHASDEVRRASEATRHLGAGATDLQRQKIISLTEALYQEQAAMEKAKQQAEQWNQSLEAGFSMVEDAISGIVDGSVRAEDAVKRLAIQLALAAAQGALLGTGPLAGLFGGGMGMGGGFTPNTTMAGFLGVPGFASGTKSAPGGFAVVGEKGPELINMPKGSQVFPKVPQAMPAAKGGGGASVPINIQIDAKGADREGLSRVEFQVAKLRRDLPGLIDGRFATSRQRGLKIR